MDVLLEHSSLFINLAEYDGGFGLVIKFGYIFCKK